MKKILLVLIVFYSVSLFSANDILREIDKNMLSQSARVKSRMLIHTRRGSRSVSSINYSQGNDRFFSEYTDPPRERGTKMLKIDDRLWIYEPSSDRTIQISGNMLRQSVMGSDLSYEDFMEERSLAEMYKAEIIEELIFDERECYKLKLTANDENVSYPTRIIIVDKERYVVLREELYAKSGRLLKTTHSTDIHKIANRWYPKRILFKDELKEGQGTEYIIEEIEFDIEIPEHYFSRAVLRK